MFSAWTLLVVKYLNILNIINFLKILFIYSRETQRERERERERERGRDTHRQREKKAPCREPDVGLDPRSPGSGRGLKVALKR